MQFRKIIAKLCFLFLNELGKKIRKVKEVPLCAIHELSIHFIYLNIPIKFF